MAKHAAAPSGANPKADGLGKDAGRRHRKLERQLARVRDAEVKRSRQLEAARMERVRLEGELASLEAEVAGTAGPTSAPTRGAVGKPRSRKGARAVADPADNPEGPRAFCLRERRTIVMSNPTRVQLSNGRAALAGTCPNCGARVISAARRAD